MVYIVVVGKPKHYIDADREYLQRVPKNCTVVVVKQIVGLIEFCTKHTEANIYLCDEKGKTYSSLSFAFLLKNNQEQNRDSIFCIGPAEGWVDAPEELRAISTEQIALSHMTLPHDLARHVLIEQIYRAFTINSGHPYHK